MQAVLTCVDPTAENAVATTLCQSGYAKAVELQTTTLDLALPKEGDTELFVYGFMIPLTFYVVGKAIGEMVKILQRG